MTYPQYKEDLQRIHESEVYGKAVFATAARLTRNAERKAKWLKLHALEEETLARYLAHMAKSGQPVVEPKGWELKGYAEGMALGLMPWKLAMRLLRDVVFAGTARSRAFASPSRCCPRRWIRTSCRG